MKELSIEEKAVAYDKVRKKIALRFGSNVAEEIFSEFEESEDDRIRKVLLNDFKNNCSEYYCEGINRDMIIAWLEKQAEQKSTLPKWKYKKDHTPLLRDSLILNKYGCVSKSPSGAIVSDVWVIDYDELAKLPKEEFEEQSEQKPVGFNIGDEITVNGQVCRVVAVDTPAWSEKYIADVFEKVGLAKIVREQSNDNLTSALQSAMIELSKFTPQQKQEWSEDDESIRKALSNLIGMYFLGCTDISGRDRLHNWLNSIKDRVQPRPKQEWSEEDEVKINRIVACLENLNVADNDILLKDVDWLKSLRPQNMWKPSEGQLECLGYAIEKAEKDWSPLTNNRIYLTLKALKEQLLELRGSKV